VFELAHEGGKIVSLDPNYSARIWPHHKEARHVLKEMYGYVNITKPSLDDAGRIFSREYEPEQYIEMFHEMGAETVILTMGKEGVLISDDGQLLGHVPARPVEVKDATGAGDAFWAGFLVALLDGNSLERSALFARELVELKLGRVGPLPMEIDRQQLYSRMEEAHAEFENSKKEESLQDEP
jgi:fructokinase